MVHPKCVLIGAIKIFIFPIKSDNHMGSNTEKRLWTNVKIDTKIVAMRLRLTFASQ